MQPSVSPRWETRFGPTLTPQPAKDVEATWCHPWIIKKVITKVGKGKEVMPTP